MREHENAEPDRFVGKVDVMKALNVRDWRTVKRTFAAAGQPLMSLSPRNVGASCKTLQRVLQFHIERGAA